MQTRREVLTKCGAGLAAIIAAGKAPAAVVRSMLGAKGTILSKSLPLPYDHEVEWIQPSTRGAYINTGFVPIYSASRVDYYDVEAVFSPNAFGRFFTFGQVWNANTLTFRFDDNKKPACYWSNSTAVHSTFLGIQNHFYHIKKDGLVTTIRDMDTGESGTISTTLWTIKQTEPVWLFGVPNYLSQNKISSIKILRRSDNARVLDMISVVDFDGIPCMYDKVSRKNFYNSGTGHFLTNEDA